MSNLDQRGADGETVREAIARRTLGGIAELIEAHKDGALDFEATHRALKVLVEVTLPFCDPTSKDVVNQVMSQWDRERENRRQAAAELDLAESNREGFGAWATG